MIGLEENILITFFTILLPLLGAAIGFLIKQRIEKRKQLLSEVNKERRSLYQQYVDLIVDILNNTKAEEPVGEEDYVQKIFQFYKKYILYASPEVINAFSDYFQYLYKTNSSTEQLSQKEHFVKLSRIMFQMRKDLGLSNSKLGKNGENIFRALIIDFDKIMK